MADEGTSEHAVAQAIIEELRTAAVAVKGLGEELVAAKRRVGELEIELESQLDAAEEVKRAWAMVEEWSVLLEDFRRELFTREELLDRTVGSR